MSRVDLHPEELLDAERCGTLDLGQRDRLDAHAAECGACAFERLAARDFEPVVRPREGDDELIARLVDGVLEGPDAAVERAPTGGRRDRSYWAPFAAGAALAAGAAGVFWITGSSSRGVADAITAEPEARAVRAEDPPARSEQLPTPELTPRPEPTSEPLPTPVPVRPPLPEIAPARPPAPEADLFSRANEARRRGDAEQAVRLYDELVRSAPSSREALTSRVTAGRLRLDELGDARGALASFDAYLAAAPAGPLAEEARVGRAQSLLQLGRTGEEAAAWRELLERHPMTLHRERAERRLDALDGAGAP